MRGTAGDALAYAITCRNQQNMEEAWAVISDAAKNAPNDPKIAFAHAQFSFETWRPAAKLFRDAQRLDPDNLGITRNAAAALVAEGQWASAEKLLERTLFEHPDWIDGHKSLATLRITSGEGASSFRSFETACKARSHHMPLRMAWFHSLCISHEWDAARKVIADSIASFGEQRAFTVAQIYLASESGETAVDFAPLADMQDAGLDLCQVRYALRNGQPEHAAEIAARHIGTPAASTFWPYLSIAWRLAGNPKAAWLDGDPPVIAALDLDFSVTELDELAQLLRQLHISSAPYPEQSVRGGTQTDRQLFFHHSPVIQRARARFRSAVAQYIADMPLIIDAHPFLGIPRDDIRFEGSWSVRLSALGFHSCHTHNRGWISSAFYVALPGKEQMGAEPAGWITFGTPPPELGLDLAPYARIEPKPGRLVLFPSILWHGTVPFEDGERLTIAFDICKPQF
jgi:Tfp pilus assembly protein PilF